MASGSAGSESSVSASRLSVPLPWFVGGMLFVLTQVGGLATIGWGVFVKQDAKSEVSKEQALAEQRWKLGQTAAIELLTEQTASIVSQLETVRKDLDRLDRETNKKSPYDWKRDQMDRAFRDAERMHSQPFPDVWDPKYDRKE